LCYYNGILTEKFINWGAYLFPMPGLVWKTINKKKYLVIRWKKRINGKSRIIKEVYVGDLDKLATIIENPMKDINALSLSYGTSAAVFHIESMLNLKSIINEVVGHTENGLSPGDYAIIFIANRLSDPRSKNGISEWMKNDFISTKYRIVTSQSFWNIMERIDANEIKAIMDRIKEKLLSLGYDASKLFIDASNVYTFMEENEMAKKGYNKKHRYDLNQISYYIASNLDYIPLYGESYPGNVFDGRTFKTIIMNIPKSAIIIFDSGYNSEENISLISDRKYIGSLRPSDNHELLDIPIEEYKDGYYETMKHTLGKDHRIIIYFSKNRREREERSLLKSIECAIEKCQSILKSGLSNKDEKIMNILEKYHLQETILLKENRLEIDQEHLNKRIDRLGKTILFTNIMDLEAQEIIELYKKRNRVEHCFREISRFDLISPIYHWTPKKIKVHMFLSYLAYLFLSLIYNEAKKADDNISLETVLSHLSPINIIYLTDGKKTKKVISTKDETGMKILKYLNLERFQ